MTEMSIALQLSVSEEQFPPYDPAHGTPHAMVRRVLTIRRQGAAAVFEQTDYGHPGRFNPWSPRGIDTALQPRARELAALAEAATPLID